MLSVEMEFYDSTASPLPIHSQSPPSLSPSSRNYFDNIKQWNVSIDKLCTSSDVGYKNFDDMRYIHNKSSNGTSRQPSSPSPSSTSMSTSSISIEKKVDTIVRRVKVLEDKLKAIDCENLELKAQISTQNQVIEKLSESQRSDRKLSLLLRQHIEEINNRTNRIDEKIETIATDNSSSSDVDTHHMIISSVKDMKLKLISEINTNMSNQINNKMVLLGNEQNTILKQWTEQYNSNMQFPITIEKEVAILKGEIDAISQKMELFQHLCHDVASDQANASNNMESTIDCVVKKSNEQLRQYSSSMASATEEIKDGMIQLAKLCDRIRLDNDKAIDVVNHKIVDGNKKVDEISKKMERLLSSTTSKILSEVAVQTSQLNIDSMQRNQKLEEQVIKRLSGCESKYNGINDKIGEQMSSLRVDYNKEMKKLTEFVIPLSDNLNVYKLENDRKVDHLSSSISLLSTQISESEAASRLVLDSIISSVNEGSNDIEIISNNLNLYVLSSTEEISTLRNDMSQLQMKLISFDGYSINHKLHDYDNFKEETLNVLMALTDLEKKNKETLKDVCEKVKAFPSKSAVIDRVVNEFNAKSESDTLFYDNVVSAIGKIETDIAALTLNSQDDRETYVEKCKSLEVVHDVIQQRVGMLEDSVESVGKMKSDIASILDNSSKKDVSYSDLLLRLSSIESSIHDIEASIKSAIIADEAVKATSLSPKSIINSSSSSGGSGILTSKNSIVYNDSNTTSSSRGMSDEDRYNQLLKKKTIHRNNFIKTL